MFNNTGYYDILNVRRDCHQSLIKKSQNKLSLIFHPDKGGNSEDFRNISKAYEILSNEVERKKQDTFLITNKVDSDGVGCTAQYSIIDHLLSLLKSKGTKIQYTIDKENKPAEESLKPKSFTSKEENQAKITIEKTLEFIRNFQERMEELMCSTAARIQAKFAALVKESKNQINNQISNDYVKSNFAKDKKQKAAQSFMEFDVNELAIVNELRNFTNGMEDKMSLFTKMSEALNKIVEMDNKYFKFQNLSKKDGIWWTNKGGFLINDVKEKTTEVPCHIFKYKNEEYVLIKKKDKFV